MKIAWILDPLLNLIEKFLTNVWIIFLLTMNVAFLNYNSLNRKFSISVWIIF